MFNTFSTLLHYPSNLSVHLISKGIFQQSSIRIQYSSSWYDLSIWGLHMGAFADWVPWVWRLQTGLCAFTENCAQEWMVSRPNIRLEISSFKMIYQATSSWIWIEFETLATKYDEIRMITMSERLTELTWLMSKVLVWKSCAFFWTKTMYLWNLMSTSN